MSYILYKDSTETVGNFIAQKTSVLQLMLQLLVFTPTQENKSQILLHLDIRQIMNKAKYIAKLAYV